MLCFVTVGLPLATVCASCLGGGGGGSGATPRLSVRAASGVLLSSASARPQEPECDAPPDRRAVLACSVPVCMHLTPVVCLLVCVCVCVCVAVYGVCSWSVVVCMRVQHTGLVWCVLRSAR
jgi:hypothetical protein